ncbi:Uncharacterised protein [Mycobacteroides abscessus]|nr:Uncharacterised protein [Mycobacteroides abscessus]
MYEPSSFRTNPGHCLGSSAEAPGHRRVPLSGWSVTT